MLRLAFFFICVYYVNAKMTLFLDPNFEPFSEDNEMVPKKPAFHKEEVFASSVGSGNLWAIKIDNDLDSVKLKRANAKQEQEFDDVVPKRVFLPWIRVASVTIDKNNVADSIPSHDEVSALKEEILRTFNKFVMSIRKEPDSYLPDTEEAENSPYLQLYFHKDRRALMVVSSVKRVWFYPLAPSTVFPEWLHQPHADAVEENGELFVEIPSEVQEHLYKTLEMLLHKMLGVRL